MNEKTTVTTRQYGINTKTQGYSMRIVCLSSESIIMGSVNLWIYGQHLFDRYKWFMSDSYQWTMFVYDKSQVEFYSSMKYSYYW